jgi:flagellum-specific peptidoglycan hydrolase FlgJ
MRRKLTKFPYTLLLLISFLIVGSCGAKKKISKKNTTVKKEVIRIPKDDTTPVITVNEDLPVETPYEKPNSTMTYAEVVALYINNFKEIAQTEMRLYGIPASIKLAQGILESGAGRGDLTSRSNNHFGIKCHNWTGDVVYHDDDELQECFRKYNDPKYSFRDHSLFLTGRPRYSDLFKLKKDDYKGWARGLRKAGYATDPKYPEKLIRIIEQYELYKLDAEVLGNEVTVVKDEENKINTYTVRPGDTLYSIGKRFNIPVETLKQYNGLLNNDIKVGQVLYLNTH